MQTKIVVVGANAAGAKAASKALAKEIAGRVHRDGSRALYFTEKDRRIYTLAQVKSESLGLEVDEVCRKYGELQQRLKTGTLEEAVVFSTATASVSGMAQRLRACMPNTSSISPNAAWEFITCVT